MHLGNLPTGLDKPDRYLLQLLLDCWRKTISRKWLSSGCPAIFDCLGIVATALKGEYFLPKNWEVTILGEVEMQDKSEIIKWLYTEWAEYFIFDSIIGVFTYLSRTMKLFCTSCDCKVQHSLLGVFCVSMDQKVGKLVASLRAAGKTPTSACQPFPSLSSNFNNVWHFIQLEMNTTVYDLHLNLKSLVVFVFTH